MRIGALQLFARGYGPDGPSDFYSLASWHNPRSITWRWVIHWWPTTRRWFGLSRYRHNCGGNLTLTLPLVRTVSFSWQHPMWRDDS